MIRLPLLAAFVLLHLTSSGRAVPFDESERFVCLGDSITHGGLYPYDLQLFQLLRSPGSTARVLNAGHAGGSARGALQRWSWDVAPMRGTRVLVFFGMNDVRTDFYGADSEELRGKRQRALTAYAENLRKLVETIESAGSKAILATPTPYDEYGARQKQEPRRGANEQGLSACAEIVRTLSKGRGLPLVELHRPLTARLKAGDEGFVLDDRIHPTDDSHLLILRELLNAFGVTQEVASVRVRADGDILETRRTAVRSVSASSGELAFTYAPLALPFPGLPGEREMLYVADLPAGDWELRADDRPLGVFTSSELAGGVNLAKLETPSAVQARKAQEKMLAWRKADARRRDLVKMEIVADEQGADVKDFEASVKALDSWFERFSAKGVNVGYYADLMAFYKANARDRTGLDARTERLYEELVRQTRPVSWRISLHRR